MQGSFLPPPASTLARPSRGPSRERSLPRLLSLPRADREKEGSSLLTVHAKGTEVRKQFLLAPSDPPISAPSRRHFGKSRTRRQASFSSPFLTRGGRTAPKKGDGQTHIVGLDRGTRSRRGTYYGTGTYCGTGEGACGILKVWNFKVRVQGWGLEGW